MSNPSSVMLGARRILPAAALFAMALAPAPAGATAAADVIVSDNFFQPETLTVQAGSTVLWEQQGNLPHNVTADDDSWSSHPACSPALPGTCMADGDTYSRAFPEPGTFGYYCTLHGTPGNGMAGTVRVVEPGFVFPTEVLDLRTSRSGNTLRVLGAASFGGVASLEVGTDPTGDGAQNYPQALGFDLVKASIGQPDPRTGNLSFMIDAADLPPTGGVPEMAWYSWDFAVLIEDQPAAGFIIRGRPTNVTRETRVPSFFLDRCTGSGGGIPCEDTTEHPLDASMNGDTNRISANVPRALLEQLVGAPVDGAQIRTTGNVPLPNGAAVQAVPANSALGPTYDQVVITGAYTVATPEVRLGIVPSGGTPAFDTPAVVANDGSFEASLDVSGLAPGAYDVWAQACFGTNCDTVSTPVTL
jgi:plastocyanin